MGANDVINPAARTQQNSPIFGMPILNVDQAKQVFVISVVKVRDFQELRMSYLVLDHCVMLYGDGAEVARKLTEELKNI